LAELSNRIGILSIQSRTLKNLVNEFHEAKPNRAFKLDDNINIAGFV